MLPVITVQGTDLIASGKPIILPGLSEFGLFKRYNMDNGWDALVKPILVERRAAAKAGGYEGPIVLRVFRHAASWNAFALDPWSYPMQAVIDFTNRCGNYNCYVDWTAGDYQVVLPQKDGPRGQQEHVNQFCAALSQTFAFFQLSNEPFKNGCLVRPQDVPRWGPTVLDSGYYAEIQDWDRSQNLDIISYHSGRSDGGLTPPKWLIDMNDQLAYIKTAFGKYTKLEEPIGWAKVPVPNKRFNNTQYAKEMGELADDGGIYFHCDLGLSSDGYDADTRAGVEAYWSGVAGVIR